MRDLITTFGFIGGPVGIAVVFWALLRSIGEIRDHRADDDIRRIEEGIPDSTPPVVEPEPLRRIAWETDEEFKAMVAAVRWPTDELERIRAAVMVG